MKKFINTFALIFVLMIGVVLFASCGGKINISTATNNSAYGVVTAGGSYAENENVELTATANNGYRFVRWTFDGTEYSTERTIIVIAKTDTAGTYVANFEENLLKISRIIITSSTTPSNDVEINSFEIKAITDSVYNNISTIVSVQEENEKIDDFYLNDNLNSSKLKVIGENNKVKLNISAKLNMVSTTDSYADYSQTNTYTLTTDNSGTYVTQQLFVADAKDSTAYGNITMKVFFVNA